MREHQGGCLCGRLRFAVSGRASFPHFCSCKACQRWSGAPAVAWVDFPRAKLRWIGPGGAPALYRSSKGCQRGFCPGCGGTLLAQDDGSAKACLALAAFDDPGPFVPASHSFADSAPAWLVPLVRPPGPRPRTRKTRAELKE